MPTLFRFKESRLWQRAIDLAIAVNHVMRAFPEKERRQDSLCSQLLEAAVSVPTRIAESYEPFMRAPDELLQQARYHLTETELLLDLARYRGYMSHSERQRMAAAGEELRELLNRHIRGLHPPEYVTGLRND
jgi:four helix bundle protein